MQVTWMIDKKDRDIWNENLSKWQYETVGYLPMFSTEIELSRDYTDFMLGIGGPFVALLLGLANRQGQMCREFCYVLKNVLDKLSMQREGLQLALWLCHVTAVLGLKEEFELGRRFINQAGGLPLGIIISPPSYYSIECNEEDVFGGDSSMCPKFGEFTELALQAHSMQPVDRTRIAMAVLDNDNYYLEWNTDLLAALWNPAQE